jgi:hypothetical protein
VVDLTTRYLGLVLEHPFMPGASPLANDLDMVLRLEDAGAAAIVMPSLFEEDVVRYDQRSDSYLEQLVRIKRRASVPVIASIHDPIDAVKGSDGWGRRCADRLGPARAWP